MVQLWLFLTDNDASAYTEADSHTEACSLVTALSCRYHVFELSLKVKGVNQPLIYIKKGKFTIFFCNKYVNAATFLL